MEVQPKKRNVFLDFKALIFSNFDSKKYHTRTKHKLTMAASAKSKKWLPISVPNRIKLITKPSPKIMYSFMPIQVPDAKASQPTDEE